MLPVAAPPVPELEEVGAATQAAWVQMGRLGGQTLPQLPQFSGSDSTMVYCGPPQHWPSVGSVHSGDWQTQWLLPAQVPRRHTRLQPLRSQSALVTQDKRATQAPPWQASWPTSPGQLVLVMQGM